jgi:ribA/ribD-fused uncharacterized protein
MIQNPTHYIYYRRHCFNNWHYSNFVFEGIQFDCSEQYLMWAKAIFFGDTETAVLILAAQCPLEAKERGDKIKGVDESIWSRECVSLAVMGLCAKFSQNPRMKKELLDTQSKIIVEANPHDRIWGVGLEEHDDKIWDKDQWLGENRQGIALMQTRDILRLIDTANYFKSKINL